MGKTNRLGLLMAFGVGAFIASRLVRKANPYTFKDKVVVITGGSRGLGLLLARELASQGAHIAICARDKDELLRARQELERLSAEVFAAPCDITDRTQVIKMIRSVREYFGRIDVLINNAGTIQVGPYNVMTIEDYEEAMNIHYWGPLYTILATLPHMRERGEGRIVNISSIGGKISVPHLLPYSASKFALVGLSEGLRSELKKEGIIVTTVCPGLMRTGSPKNISTKGQHEKEYTWFKVADSLPISSMNATLAAKKIIEACRQGDAELILTFSAKLASAVHGLFPGFTTDLFAGVNRLLPDAGEQGSIQRKKGEESETFISSSFIAGLTDEAAERNNE